MLDDVITMIFIKKKFFFCDVCVSVCVKVVLDLQAMTDAWKRGDSFCGEVSP